MLVQHLTKIVLIFIGLSSKADLAKRTPADFITEISAMRYTYKRR